MNIRQFTILFCLIAFNCKGQNKIGAIGQWREHYSNYNVQQIILGDHLYAATAHQLFYMDSTNAINYIGKSNGLNEIGISSIAWDKNQSQLVIAYNNSSIDIMQDDQVYLINDIALTSLYASKKINHITIEGNWAFVSTNFGIVVIDLIKHEIKDSWFPNNNRQASLTYQTAVLNDSLYAVTKDGLMICPLKDNWILANQWKNLSQFNDPTLTKLYPYKGNMFVYNKHQIYKTTQANAVFNYNIGDIQKLSSDQSDLIVITQNNNKGNLLRINSDYSSSTIIQGDLLSNPLDVLAVGSTLWIADTTNGLLAYHSNNNNWINIGGPRYPIKGNSSIDEANFITPFGNNKNGIAVYNESGWHNYTTINNALFPVISATAVNPKQGTYWLGSLNKIIQSSQDFKKIDSTILNNSTGDITAIAFTNAGNGWALQAGEGLVQLQNNAWVNITAPVNYKFTGLNKMIVNQQEQAWIPAPKNQGLYIYQSAKYYNSPVWKQLSTSSNNGNLPSANVTSLIQDANGAIWVGTDNGIGIFQCGDLNTSPCNAFIPTVNNNGFNGYLFQKETVNCMAVDGANRKWIGTNNGVWLLSSDGYDIIEHFTQATSPLPSDTVLQIKISPLIGEVFFICSNQMASYRGMATKGLSKQKTMVIFPNPVAPDYTGLISFKGLVENALVKITDLNGKLIFQTRALGGQAIWNGKTYEGNKPATGIYLVFVRDEAGNENGVGKIMITSGH